MLVASSMDAFFIYVPIVLTTTMHMFIVKFNSLSSLNIPVSENLFGRNKTWRGIVFVIAMNSLLTLLLNAVVEYFSVLDSFILGICLGFGYVFFELPNSYLKRRLGIPPGGKAKQNKWLFIIIDRLDSAFGVVLAYKLFVGLSWSEFIAYLTIGMLIHFVFSSILYLLKVKKSL